MIGTISAVLAMTMMGTPAAATGTAEVATLHHDTLVVRVEQIGGFLPAGHQLTRLPTISVYADGRVITEGPQASVYPGRALPNVLVRRISPADARLLARRTVAAGVGTAGDLGAPGITDVPTTRFT